jgi:hypothetical protein
VHHVHQGARRLGTDGAWLLTHACAAARVLVCLYLRLLPRACACACVSVLVLVPLRAYVPVPVPVQPSATFAQVWRQFDARGKVLGRLASEIATVLMGKHKPIYHPAGPRRTCTEREAQRDRDRGTHTHTHAHTHTHTHAYTDTMHA